MHGITPQQRVQVPAEWELSCPPTGAVGADGSGAADGSTLMPPWVQAHPTCGILSPGQTVDLVFRIGVAEAAALGDPTTAETVVTRPDAPCSLSHLFVVHIATGADHFIAVDGTYRPSFFGLTLGTIAAREKAAAKAAEKAGRVLEEARAHAEDEGGEARVAEAEAAKAAADAAAAVRECHCGGDGMAYIGASPFVAAQWAVVPQPLKQMLHFLARCVPFPPPPPHAVTLRTVSASAVCVFVSVFAPTHVRHVWWRRRVRGRHWHVHVVLLDDMCASTCDLLCYCMATHACQSVVNLSLLLVEQTTSSWLVDTVRCTT